MTNNDTGFIISRLPVDVDAPGLLLVLADPAEHAGVNAYLGWYDALHAGLADEPGLARIRHLTLGDEQLLPHRAEKASHRCIAIYEFDSVRDMLAAAPGLHPRAHEGAESVVDVAGCRVAAFQQIHSTYEANPLPEGAKPRPERAVPQDGPGVFMAFTRPVDEASEAAYNDWYNNYHLPETLLLVDVVRGRRHRRIPAPEGLAGTAAIETPYLTLYDLDNVGAVPVNRDLMPWLSSVTVDHLGPAAYDRAFTQAFIFADAVGSPLQARR
jgi:hypothetical protein